MKTQPLPWPNIIALAFGSMTCVDFDCLFMLKKVICFYNIKLVQSSFNEITDGFAHMSQTLPGKTRFARAMVCINV